MLTLVYGLSVVLSLICSCIDEKGKYAIIFNYSPQKYEFPLIILGLMTIMINAIKVMINISMFKRRGEPFSYKQFLHPIWIAFFIATTLIYIPNNAASCHERSCFNMTYTLFKILSHALALATVGGYLNRSPYTNLFLTLYGVTYSVNIGTAWYFQTMWIYYTK